MLIPVWLAVTGTLLLLLRIVFALRSRDAPGNETVAVAFAPPRDLSPGLGVHLRREVENQHAITAEILNLAVAGEWKLGTRTLPGDTPMWIVHRDEVPEVGPRGVPGQVYREIFPHRSQDLTEDLTMSSRRKEGFAGVLRSLADQVTQNGWIRRPVPPGTKIFVVILWIFTAAPTLSWISNGMEAIGPHPLALPLAIGGLVAAAISLVIPVKKWVLTPEGRRLSDELDGLKLYMTMAEADRLRVLQAPDTAERRPVGPDAAGAVDPVEIAHLHERLLPWAAVFGILPQWSQVLARDFAAADHAPDWVYLPDGGGGLGDFGTFSEAGGLESLGGLESFGDDLGGDLSLGDGGFDGGGDGGDGGGDGGGGD